VNLELDLYWPGPGRAEYGLDDEDVQERVKLIHLKDRTPGASDGYTAGPEGTALHELGKGSIDWPKLLMHGQVAGPYGMRTDQDEDGRPGDGEHGGKLCLPEGAQPLESQREGAGMALPPALAVRPSPGAGEREASNGLKSMTGFIG